MRKDILAFAVAVPVVAVVVLSMNKGKAVSVQPAAKTQPQHRTSAADTKLMEGVCHSLVGKDKSKVTAKIGNSYATAGGVTFYQALKAGFKAPYAIGVTYRKNKVLSAKVVTY